MCVDNENMRNISVTKWWCLNTMNKNHLTNFDAVVFFLVIRFASFVFSYLAFRQNDFKGTLLHSKKLHSNQVECQNDLLMLTNWRTSSKCVLSFSSKNCCFDLLVWSVTIAFLMSFYMQKNGLNFFILFSSKWIMCILLI